MSMHDRCAAHMSRLFDVDERRTLSFERGL
jgi:hypothetical protein